MLQNSSGFSVRISQALASSLASDKRIVERETMACFCVSEDDHDAMMQLFECEEIFFVRRA